MNMQVLNSRHDLGGGYKVDLTRGTRVGRVSSEWFSRPDDQRFLSLGDLARSVRGRSERSRTRVVESALIHVEASRNDPERPAALPEVITVWEPEGDPLPGQLRACSAMGELALSSPDCRAAWAEKRRRFLGVGSDASEPAVDAAALPPVTEPQPAKGL